MDTVVVVPLKDPEGAKKRLSELLTITQRRELALSLMDHVIGVFRKFQSRTDVLIISFEFFCVVNGLIDNDIVLSFEVFGIAVPALAEHSMDNSLGAWQLFLSKQIEVAQ